jgi:hypothetical protein
MARMHLHLHLLAASSGACICIDWLLVWPGHCARTPHREHSTQSDAVRSNLSFCALLRQVSRCVAASAALIVTLLLQGHTVWKTFRKQREWTGRQHQSCTHSLRARSTRRRGCRPRHSGRPVLHRCAPCQCCAAAVLANSVLRSIPSAPLMHALRSIPSAYQVRRSCMRCAGAAERRLRGGGAGAHALGGRCV